MLIQTEVGRAEVVAKQIAALPGVLSSEYVTGPYDVVVRVGASTLTEPAGRRRVERARYRRHHPHPDLPDRPNLIRERRRRPTAGVFIAAVAFASRWPSVHCDDRAQSPTAPQPVADSGGPGSARG